MENPSCHFAEATEMGGETFYECSKRSSPCYQSVCDTDMCTDNNNSRSNDDCMHKDYNGLCQNDDTYNHGDYCPGHCDFYEG